MLGLTFAPLAPPATAATSDCATIGVRQEFRTLSDAEWERFVSAVKRLMERPSAAQPSHYDRFANDYGRVASQTHNNAMFLAYNRQNLRAFEIELQKIDPEVTLPYWDWSRDSQAPELSPIFSAEYLGGNGDPMRGNAVTDGPFRDAQFFYPQPHPLKREFNEDGRLGAFYSSEQLNQIIMSSSTYDALRRGLEVAPNGIVHVNIGGDMATMYAPNDPIFWLHRAYIDKLWDDWQRLKPAQANAVNGTLADRRTHMTGTTSIPHYNSRVQDVLSVAGLCYGYDRGDQGPQEPAPRQLQVQ